MSQQENNLLYFLQKQSLFTQPSRFRSRSRSRRSRGRDSQGNVQLQSRFINRLTYPTEPRDAQQTSRQATKRMWNTQPNPPTSRDYFRTNHSQQNYQSSQYDDIKTASFYPVETEIQVPSQANKATFQSAHIESLQCLQAISNKMKSKMAQIDSQRDNFNRKVRSWISEQLFRAQQYIIRMVTLAFKEQQSVIKSYIAKQEQHYNVHLLHTRKILQQEYTRVVELQQHLKGPDWRKAAGEIVSSNLQRKIDNFLTQTDRVHGPQWVPRSFVEDHLRIIELQVHEIFRLTTFAC